MRPHILGLVHAVLLSGAMSEHAGDSSGGAATAVSTDPVPLISTLTNTTTLAAAAEVTVDALATSTSGPSGTVAEHWPALRPANTSRADAWARLREACPWYFAPLPVVDNIPEMDPAPVAPPAPDRELEAEKIESFEEWKRRKEAEDAPAPHADEVPAPAENKSADAGAAPHVLENNTAPESAPPPPAAPKLTGGHRYNYNYASPDCSARVLSSSPLTQHASSLLHKSRDRYMLTPCRADEHWVVVELCDEIRVEAIELAVWEFFSGIVRGVTVSVGDDATGASWTQVGEFVGKNVRGAQAFSLPEPTSFHRFLRLDFPSFYGSEYYCPVSQLKVYGMNQMEAFKMEQRRAAEATGVKTREREQAREQERDKPKEVEQRDTEREAAEREREKERASAAAEAAAREEQRADEEKREKELCELEKLVQEQARRAGLVLDPSEPLLETSSCIPEYATSGTISASSETASPDATDASPANGPSTSSTNSSIPATSSSTYAAPQLPRTDSSESIYAFIIRRLNALEGNSTLVARYIDEQSKALRAALSRAEARWEVARVQAVRDDEQRWEVERMRHEDRMGRVVSQMEAMRSAMESQRRLTESQLRLLADEIGFERRKSLAQLVILLAVLVLGLLTRSDMLDSIINALAENKRQHTRVRPSRHQRQLSTGPLAGLLIDVASPVPRTPVPSTPTIPTQPDANLRVSTGKPARRQLAPSASLRRRNTSNSRSFSAEPSLLMDLDLEDELTSPSRRSLVANPPRRRIARSAHLHPIRRRGDESSEAEGARTSEGGRVRLPPSPSPVPTPVSAPSGSAARSPHYLAFPPGPLTAPSTIVSGESTDVSAPGSTADSASADSASEVEDAVERVRSVSGSTVRFGMRLVDKFAAAGFGDDDDDVDAEVRSFRSVRSSKSMRRIERAREKEKEREKGKDREWTQDEKR